MGFGSPFPRFLTVATKPRHCEALGPGTERGAAEQSCAGVCVGPGPSVGLLFRSCLLSQSSMATPQRCSPKCVSPGAGVSLRPVRLTE